MYGHIKQIIVISVDFDYVESEETLKSNGISRGLYV